MENLAVTTRFTIARCAVVFLVGLYAAIVSAQSAGASDVSRKYSDVARCFFVYAALNESARKHSRQELESYALQRLMWFRGFNEALIADQVWKAAFEANIKENKAKAEVIEANISAALARNSVRDYNAAIAPGEECDLRLGLYPRKR